MQWSIYHISNLNNYKHVLIKKQNRFNKVKIILKWEICEIYEYQKCVDMNSYQIDIFEWLIIFLILLKK